MHKDFVYISPKFQVHHFTELNLSLESEQEVWDKAIDIFKDRIENRFILIIQDMLGHLRDNFKSIDYSFSIMAINCLLVETLRQFKIGVDQTKEVNNDAFVRFFKNSEDFKMHLPEKLASIFYRHIRCGILHQAQTQSNSQLTFDQEVMIKEIEGDCIRVDVELFTYALFQDYERYLRNLIQADSLTRRNFIKKMNFIVEKISV